MAEFWHYFALTLPVALAVWALIEWWQRRRPVPSPRREPTFEAPTFEAPVFEAPAPDRPRPGLEAGCPHPHFKRVYVLRGGASVPTDEMQCVQCKQRMKA